MPKAFRDVVVLNEHGFHFRPVMYFVDLANTFKCEITLIKGGESPGRANGKSTMETMVLAAIQGTPIRIEADGEDAEQAVEKLAELFATQFGETEGKG